MLFHETNESDIQLFHSISIIIHVKYNCNSGTSKFACMHEIYIYSQFDVTICKYNNFTINALNTNSPRIHIPCIIIYVCQCPLHSHCGQWIAILLR